LVGEEDGRYSSSTPARGLVPQLAPPPDEDAGYTTGTPALHPVTTFDVIEAPVQLPDVDTVKHGLCQSKLWSVCIFVLVVEMCERITYYTFAGSQRNLLQRVVSPPYSTCNVFVCFPTISAAPTTSSCRLSFFVKLRHVLWVIRSSSFFFALQL